MYKLLLLEDNEACARQTCERVRAEFGDVLALKSFTTVEEFEQSNFIPDIALIDIELNGENGIQYVRKLNVMFPDCAVIFLTGYIHYAVEAYTAEHVYFVTKEAGEQVLFTALNKAMARISLRRSRRLALPKKNGTEILVMADILYLERVQRTTRIVSCEEEHTTGEKLESLLDRLDSRYFVRTHQSFVVNLMQITRLTRTMVELRGGAQAPVSRRYRAALQAELGRYITEET